MGAESDRIAAMQRGPSPVLIRTARAGDLAGLLALETQFPGDRMSRRQFRHHLANPRACLRVLLHEKVIAGYALLLLHAGRDAARLYSIAVDERWRGRGFGAQLLADAEAQARRRGKARLRLEVRSDNRAARALYEARGYRAIRHLPRYYEDGGAGYRYEKALAAKPGR